MKQDKIVKKLIQIKDEKIDELSREVKRLKSVINKLPGSIYWKNTDGVYLGINEHSRHMMKRAGLGHKTIVGHTDYDLFPKDIADKFRKNDLLVLQKGQTIIEEEPTIVSKKKIYQLSTKKAITDENGKIIGIVGNTVDITHLKKTENKLKKAKQDAEAANKMKTEFVRNMEHDIRTPFNGILGIANYLWGIETDPEKKEYLLDIKQSAKELLDYCNRILDFSRIERGNHPVLFEKFDIKKLLKDIMIAELPAAKYKKLELALDCAADVPCVVIGDQYRLYRILINLVSNAIKFTETGKIGITVRKVKSQNHKHVILKIIVKDTGIGISEDKQNFVYQEFARIDPANRGVYKGIGLGLHIVKKFIDEVAGEIDIKSTLGNGTSFICTIPYKLPLISDDKKEL